MSACFTSDDELIKKKAKVKGLPVLPLQKPLDFPERGLREDLLSTWKYAMSDAQRVLPSLPLGEMVTDLGLTTHTGSEQGGSVEGNHGGCFTSRESLFVPSPTRPFLYFYLMFFRTAVRAFTTALKASSLPGATHLSGCSSTASLR